MRLQTLFIVFAYIIAFLLDLYIWNDLRNLSIYKFRSPANKKRKIWSNVFIIFAVAVLAEFTVAVCLPHRSQLQDISTKMWMLYVFVTIMVSEIIYFLFSLIGFVPVITKGLFKNGKSEHSDARKGRLNTGFWIGLPVALICFISLWFLTIVDRKQIKVEKVEIYSDKLPESFDGYTIAQISDLHVGSWGKDTTFISKLVDSVNRLHPDLIVFTGDLVNREATELEPFEKTLSRLSAPDGVLSVLGNHDYGDYISWKNQTEKFNNLERFKKMQRDMGWTLLDNRHLYISSDNGDSITVIGVGNWGEPPYGVKGNLDIAYPKNKQNDSNFKILLSHNPEHWNRVVSKVSNIDLTLSGHTHAMQVMLHVGNLKWSPSKYKYQQWGGLFTRKTKNGEDVNIYVNIGAGTVGMPMRLGAIPEITLFTLRKKR